MQPMVRRILGQLAAPDLLERAAQLPPSDFSSLLLAMFARRAQAASPQQVLQAMRGSRFACPSSLDPVAMHRLEAALLQRARQQGIQPRLLSPVAPFGSCSAFGCVSQDKVLSAVRGMEVAPDPSNLLALLLAQDLLAHRIGAAPVHYAATLRVVRAQPGKGGEGMAHFGVLGIASYGRDTGSYRCEQQLLQRHLQYYCSLFDGRADGQLLCLLRRRGGYRDTEGFFERAAGFVRCTFPQLALELQTGQEQNAYYRGLNFKLYWQQGETRFEVADGGFTDWLGRLTGSKKERCLVSGLGLERMLQAGGEGLCS